MKKEADVGGYKARILSVKEFLDKKNSKILGREFECTFVEYPDILSLGQQISFHLPFGEVYLGEVKEVERDFMKDHIKARIYIREN